jgi:gamma-glutamyltranspeptidase/glutathione hydrolase
MTDGGEVNLETGFPYETVRALMRKGHRIVFADGPYGGYQAIMRDPETGVYYGLRRAARMGRRRGTEVSRPPG